jgi:hypothetical protein
MSIDENWGPGSDGGLFVPEGREVVATAELGDALDAPGRKKFVPSPTGHVGPVNEPALGSAAEEYIEVKEPQRFSDDNGSDVDRELGDIFKDQHQKLTEMRATGVTRTAADDYKVGERVSTTLGGSGVIQKVERDEVENRNMYWLKTDDGKEGWITHHDLRKVSSVRTAVFQRGDKVTMKARTPGAGQLSGTVTEERFDDRSGKMKYMVQFDPPYDTEPPFYVAENEIRKIGAAEPDSAPQLDADQPRAGTAVPGVQGISAASDLQPGDAVLCDIDDKTSGIVLDVEGDQVMVQWQDGSTSEQPLADLRKASPVVRPLRTASLKKRAVSVGTKFTDANHPELGVLTVTQSDAHMVWAKTQTGAAWSYDHDDIARGIDAGTLEIVEGSRRRASSDAEMQTEEIPGKAPMDDNPDAAVAQEQQQPMGHYCVKCEMPLFPQQIPFHQEFGHDIETIEQAVAQGLPHSYSFRTAGYRDNGKSEGESSFIPSDMDQHDLDRIKSGNAGEIAGEVLEHHQQMAGSIYYDRSVSPEDLDRWEQGFTEGFTNAAQRWMQGRAASRRTAADLPAVGDVFQVVLPEEAYQAGVKLHIQKISSDEITVYDSGDGRSHTMSREELDREIRDGVIKKVSSRRTADLSQTIPEQAAIEVTGFPNEGEAGRAFHEHEKSQIETRTAEIKRNLQIASMRKQALQDGDDVKISQPGDFGGAFDGKTGTIQGIEMDGGTKMYRVRLDTPVNIPGIGQVTDDLWSSKYLKKLRSIGSLQKQAVQILFNNDVEKQRAVKVLTQNGIENIERGVNALDVMDLEADREDIEEMLRRDGIQFRFASLRKQAEIKPGDVVHHKSRSSGMYAGLGVVKDVLGERAVVDWDDGSGPMLSKEQISDLERAPEEYQMASLQKRASLRQQAKSRMFKDGEDFGREMAQSGSTNVEDAWTEVWYTQGINREVGEENEDEFRKGFEAGFKRTGSLRKQAATLKAGDHVVVHKATGDKTGVVMDVQPGDVPLYHVQLDDGGPPEWIPLAKMSKASLQKTADGVGRIFYDEHGTKMMVVQILEEECFDPSSGRVVPRQTEVSVPEEMAMSLLRSQEQVRTDSVLMAQHYPVLSSQEFPDEQRRKLFASAEDAIVNTSATMQAAFRRLKGAVFIEAAHIEKTLASDVDEDGKIVHGSVRWRVHLDSPRQNRKIVGSVEVPIQDGEPVEPTEIVMSTGVSYPLDEKGVLAALGTSDWRFDPFARNKEPNATRAFLPD